MSLCVHTRLVIPRNRGGITISRLSLWGRLAGVKMGLGCLADADYPWYVSPSISLVSGPRPGRVTHCCFEHAGQNFGSLDRSPQATRCGKCVDLVGGQAK